MRPNKTKTQLLAKLGFRRNDINIRDIYKMNFNIDLGQWVVKMLDKYETSQKVRNLIHAILFLVFLFAVASILQGVGAVKWW